ncbi:interleukin-13 receptor subunit alpha-1 [Cololabis saira]|uniref:interleukin-13 receptor subunit alpha-1 n=1 Tax=Cololabis saira TaxID=129043 RepID=UPI002AD4DCF6|nr:interleukin-13 receptor subunit alpha-1 [Cololabis saira]
MFQHLGLLFLIWILVTVEWTAGEILPPQNLSVRWIHDFEPELSWTPPPDLWDNCTFKVCIEDQDHNCQRGNLSEYAEYMIMEGGFLPWSVTTHCPDQTSAKVYYNISYPELVQDLQCYIYEAERVNCSWSPARDVTDLRFFYRLRTHFGEDDDAPELQECSLYTDVRKTGCNLKAKANQEIDILFKATQNDTVVRNTFKRELLANVKPPPLKWNVTQNADSFNITWAPPEILGLTSWSFVINYTVCDEKKTLTVEAVTSHVLARVPHCRYCIVIGAVRDGGSTPPSDQKCLDADENRNVLVYAAVFIPLLVFGLAALAAFCCWENKDNIISKVPKPIDLISEIWDSKNAICNLSTMAVEEESCKVTLVVDSPLEKPGCRNKPDANSSPS